MNVTSVDNKNGNVTVLYEEDQFFKMTIETIESCGFLLKAPNGKEIFVTNEMISFLSKRIRA